MGKQLTSIQSKLAARRESTREQLAGLSSGSGMNMIRISNRTFHLPPDGDVKIKDKIDVVVVGFGYRYQYYTSAYNANERSFPDCFAVGFVPRDLAPSDNSPNKQSDRCSTCPQNQFGSAPNGRAKACQNRVQLAVQIAEHGPESDLYIISASPTSGKAWRQYVDNLAKYGKATIDVVTRISFNPNVAYDQLRFDGVRKLSGDELEAYGAQIDAADETLLFEPSPPSDDD